MNVQDKSKIIYDNCMDLLPYSADCSVNLNNIEEAKKKIGEVSENDIHPFYKKYQDQENIKPIKFIWKPCCCFFSIVYD